MKKHTFIEVILVIVILGVSFWNAQQQHEILSLRESLAVQKDKHISLKEREKELRQENEQLSEEALAYSESLMKLQNVEQHIGVDLDLNSEFINVVTQLFENSLNFTPKNYVEKKTESFSVPI